MGEEAAVHTSARSPVQLRIKCRKLGKNPDSCGDTCVLCVGDKLLQGAQREEGQQIQQETSLCAQVRHGLGTPQKKMGGTRAHRASKDEYVGAPQSAGTGTKQQGWL